MRIELYIKFDISEFSNKYDFLSISVLLSLTSALTQLVSVSHHRIFTQLCYIVYMITHKLPKYIVLTEYYIEKMFWQICSLCLLSTLGRNLSQAQESEDQFVQTVQARILLKSLQGCDLKYSRRV